MMNCSVKKSLSMRPMVSTAHGNMMTGTGGRERQRLNTLPMTLDSFDRTPSGSRNTRLSSSAGPASTTGQDALSGANQGVSRQFRGFKDIDENKLRELLPSQAKHLASTFIDEAKKNNLDPRFLVAISKFETANWTSSAFRNKNNAMGVSNSNGPISFGRAEESIARMARGLASSTGFYRGANTIGQVGAIYAPVGASNDPNGTNGHWPRSVARFTDELAQQLG
jgi:hypothetical protein